MNWTVFFACVAWIIVIWLVVWWAGKRTE